MKKTKSERYKRPQTKIESMTGDKEMEKEIITAKLSTW